MTNNNYRPDIPKSLQKRCRRNIIIRVTSCCILFALFLFAVIMWGERIFPMPRFSPKSFAAVQISCYILFMTLPFLITGVPMKLIDSSWSGVISNVEVKQSIGTYWRTLGRFNVYDKQELNLTIKKDDGKTTRHTATSVGEALRNTMGILSAKTDLPNQGKITDHVNDFKIGDRVHKYYGFKYLYVVPSEEEDKKRCIVCGLNNDKHRDKCLNCYCDLL